MTKKNAEANNLDIDVVKADVFDYLVKLDQEHNHDFDYIILDPPAFTKSGKTVHEAFRGYKEINYRAMKILPRGGYLATCSCSHFMGEELFVKMVKEAARDAGVTLRQIEFRQQAPDHPILMTVPETYYLKFFLSRLSKRMENKKDCGKMCNHFATVPFFMRIIVFRPLLFPAGIP